MCWMLSVALKSHLDIMLAKVPVMCAHLMYIDYHACVLYLYGIIIYDSIINIYDQTIVD